MGTLSLPRAVLPPWRALCLYAWSIGVRVVQKYLRYKEELANYPKILLSEDSRKLPVPGHAFRLKGQDPLVWLPQRTVASYGLTPCSGFGTLQAPAPVLPSHVLFLISIPFSSFIFSRLSSGIFVKLSMFPNATSFLKRNGVSVNALYSVQTHSPAPGGRDHPELSRRCMLVVQPLSPSCLSVSRVKTEFLESKACVSHLCILECLALGMCSVRLR